ncbi:hypothetical protein AKJ09_08122 [Labilithrix luteola]|uniref:Secreted protein n=1 Tax=Labilithrix luteola TaxID=1391654 RepID=A0A0K1Q6W5_9BACT|nr:hypothetical protein [Labilithrix luteola]AKV01459.1 hypothetical protein AKJ09_08122 [Labilithrix luteola]
MRSHLIGVASLAFALASVACTVKTTGTGNPSTGTTDGGSKVDDDKPRTGKPSTGNETPPDEGGPGTGTVGCAGIIQCIANCGDNQSCTGHCGDDASQSGLQYIRALSDCLDANACNDDTCMQQHCQSELDACLADK